MYLCTEMYVRNVQKIGLPQEQPQVKSYIIMIIYVHFTCNTWTRIYSYTPHTLYTTAYS